MVKVILFLMLLIMSLSLLTYYFISEREKKEVANHYFLALNFKEEGQYPKAEALWEKIVREHPSSPYAMKSLYQLGLLEEERKDWTTAIKRFEMVRDGPLEIDARFHGALCLENLEKFDEAKSAYEPLLLEQPDHPLTGFALCGLGKIALLEGKKEDAMGFFEKALSTPGPHREKASQLFGQLNLSLLGNDPSTYILYSVKRGDTIPRLAKRYHASPELIVTINPLLESQALQEKALIKIPRCDFSLTLDKQDLLLTLNNYGEFFKSYSVAISKESQPIPSGEYKVVKKIKKPAEGWPGAEGLDSGHPLHLLGSRWIEVAAMSSGRVSGFGIHEALDINKAGCNSSTPCMKLKGGDLEEFFDLLTEGTGMMVEN